MGRAAAHLAKWLGFRVVVSDDRADLASPEWIPEADAYLAGALDAHLAEIKLNPQTFVLLLTRGVQFDVALLPKLLEADVAYIGVIGSRRRWTQALKELREQGVAEEKLARVHSPIGLELNAETPEEIAVSIMAEIIMIRNGGTGKSMKMTQQTIDRGQQTTDEH